MALAARRDATAPRFNNCVEGQLKHWKRGRVIYRELSARGTPPDVARRIAANSRRWWHNSAMALNMALPNDLFTKLGVPKLAG